MSNKKHGLLLRPNEADLFVKLLNEKLDREWEERNMNATEYKMYVGTLYEMERRMNNHKYWDTQAQKRQSQ